MIRPNNPPLGFPIQRQTGPAHQARAPRFEIFGGFVFANFDYIPRMHIL